MSTTEFLRPALLASLAAGPQHGYGMLNDVRSMTDGAVSPPVGSLYRVIDALVRDDLIELDHEQVVDGRNRRYFRLTESGRSALIVASETMRRVSAQASGRLASSEPRRTIKPATMMGLAQ